MATPMLPPSHSVTLTGPLCQTSLLDNVGTPRPGNDPDFKLSSGLRVLISFLEEPLHAVEPKVALAQGQEHLFEQR